MKRIKDKSKRIVKYWSIRYKQTSERERLSIGMFAMVMLMYVWWMILAY